VLDSLGIRTPAGRACVGPGVRAAAHKALDELGGPVTVKILDAAILDKSDAGGVRLGIGSHLALDAALDELPPSRALLVERMARRAPSSSSPPAAMLDDLATAALFTGARGAAAVNRDRLVHALTGLATMLSDALVREIEVNPLRVLPDGDVMALDAVLLIDQGHPDCPPGAGRDRRRAGGPAAGGWSRARGQHPGSAAEQLGVRRADPGLPAGRRRAGHGAASSA
jgi:hypothetical protein